MFDGMSMKGISGEWLIGFKHRQITAWHKTQQIAFPAANRTITT
jgi:hypothetical protein